nr:hypothetical protein BaRGS_001459 [Batillaria attramentaria]
MMMEMRMMVMDSPGMLDTDDFNSVVFTIIDYAATVKPGFDAIIYTLEIGRFTTWDLAVYERLKAVFGDGATNYIIIVFTHAQCAINSRPEVNFSSSF